MTDLKTGAGVYARLDRYIELKSGYTVVFGSSAAMFKLDSENETVSFQFVAGPKEGESFAFGPGKKVTFGRAKSNDICIDETKLSRVQCSLEYFEGKWMIRDGDGSKLTTNGTWLYLTGPCPIIDGLHFRVGNVHY